MKTYLTFPLPAGRVPGAPWNPWEGEKKEEEEEEERGRAAII